MKIEIDLNNLGLQYDPDGDPIGNSTIEDAIIQSAANLIVRETKRDLKTEILKACTAQVNELVAAEVAAVIAEPIQPTTPWGQSQGNPTTIKEMVRVRLEGYLKDPPRVRDGYITPNTIGTLSELVDQEVATMMNKEMRDVITAAKKMISDELRKKAATAVAAALVR